MAIIKLILNPRENIPLFTNEIFIKIGKGLSKTKNLIDLEIDKADILSTIFHIKGNITMQLAPHTLHIFKNEENLKIDLKTLNKFLLNLFKIIKVSLKSLKIDFIVELSSKDTKKIKLNLLKSVKFYKNLEPIIGIFKDKEFLLTYDKKELIKLQLVQGDFLNKILNEKNLTNQLNKFINKLKEIGLN